MALTYERCWSREEIRDAKRFSLDNFRRPTPDAIGCAEDMTRVYFEAQYAREDLIWVTAKNEAGEIAAAYCVQPHAEAMTGCFLRIISLAVSPAYQPDPLYFNMNVALRYLIPWPGPDAANTWYAVFPYSAALTYIQGTAFGEGMTVEDAPVAGLAVVTALRPPQDIAHTEVPLAD